MVNKKVLIVIFFLLIVVAVFPTPHIRTRPGDTIEQAVSVDTIDLSCTIPDGTQVSCSIHDYTWNYPKIRLDFKLSSSEAVDVIVKGVFWDDSHLFGKTHYYSVLTSDSDYIIIACPSSGTTRTSAIVTGNVEVFIISEITETITYTELLPWWMP